METSVPPNWKEMKMDGNIRQIELEKNKNRWKHPSWLNWKEMKMDGNIRPTELKRNENGWKPFDWIEKKWK